MCAHAGLDLSGDERPVEGEQTPRDKWEHLKSRRLDPTLPLTLRGQLSAQWTMGVRVGGGLLTPGQYCLPTGTGPGDHFQDLGLWGEAWD